MIKAVIFDFDGVIADTMDNNFLAWCWALEYNNFSNLAKFDFFLLEGKDRFEIASALTGSSSTEMIAKLVAAKDDYYRSNFRCVIFPYVLEILTFLKDNNIKIGLVTGASRMRIQHSLIDNSIDIFDCVITADDTLEHKPSPVPYLTAIENLNIKPSETIVIENAVLGIESAVLAGANCFALTTTMPETYLNKADLVFNNHLELLLYLKSNLFM